jgi:DNA-binding transcriptional MerR regulator/mannose-6-phosphate isomerase-like protein (cupin superfamily)
MERPGRSGSSGSAAALGAVGIEEAARIIGTSPSSLRLWERQGLLTPARTAGGSRRYRADDLARLRLIRSWRAVDGLNAAAIRRLLDGTAVAPPGAGGRHRPADSMATAGNGSPGSAAATSATGEAPGAALRAERRKQGLTLREVARRSGLSASFISSLELGTSGASIATLHRLAGVYGLTVGELLRDPAASGGRLVRPAERRVLDAGHGIRIEDLFAGTTTLESQLFVLAPGATSAGYYSHAGEEFMYVLSGTLGVWIDDPREFYRLEPGDALTFPSTQDHRIQALGPAETQVLWINTPPTF